MTFSLKATPDLILISGTSGITTVSYTGEGPSNRPFLWDRLNGGSWQRVDPQTVGAQSSSGDLDTDGRFQKTLMPGSLYEALLYDDVNIDPRIDLRSPVASVKVVALLVTPNRSLFLDSKIGAGGTWARADISTSKETFLRVQIGNPGDPTNSDPGFVQLNSPLLQGFDLLSGAHHLELSPLHPGNGFVAYCLVFDATGAWDTLSIPFMTLQRTVKIDFDQLHIVNDGADGETDATFDIWVREGTMTAQSFSFGSLDHFPITDRPNPGEEDREWISLFPYCTTVVLGPKSIDDTNNDVGLLVRGLAKHAWPGTNEPVANYFDFRNFPDAQMGDPTSLNDKSRIPIPTGSASEHVANQPFSTRASPVVDGNEFEFDLMCYVSITYPPA